MHFVLVHGWGFHAGLWAGFVKHLDGARVTDALAACGGVTARALIIVISMNTAPSKTIG